MPQSTDLSDQDNFDWFSSPTTGHLVQFYDNEKSLFDNLHQFISTGLAQGEKCIVIATAQHLRDLSMRLKSGGTDVSKTIFQENLVLLDAGDTLARFMVKGMPDRELFFKTITPFIENDKKSQKPIRAYGEMVAVLWEKGNEKAVIKLEQLWNELAEVRTFSLYCAYPNLHFIMDHGIRDKIHKTHNVRLSEAIVS